MVPLVEGSTLAVATLVAGVERLDSGDRDPQTPAAGKRRSVDEVHTLARIEADILMDDPVSVTVLAGLSYYWEYLGSSHSRA
jgi:hypothetical protein